jgi:hypothetical protein
MLNAILTVVVLLALPVVILLAIFSRPDPNHEFMLELIDENMAEHRHESTRID